MSRFMPPALAALLLLSGPNPVAAQLGAEAVDRGKKATALVAISHDGLLTMGSAFCIDKSGLFVTTAGVVETAAAAQKCASSRDGYRPAVAAHHAGEGAAPRR